MSSAHTHAPQPLNRFIVNDVAVYSCCSPRVVIIHPTMSSSSSSSSVPVSVAEHHNNVPNLLALSAAERQRFIDSFDTVMTDCDGTVWNLSAPIAGAEEGVDALRRHGKRIVYLSNNAIRDAEGYEQKFRESKIEATFVSATTTADLKFTPK